MNYLAHGYRFLNRPLFLAGTAVPDWLSVVNRRVRVRSRLVKPRVASTDCDTIREVGRGILQHHADDDTFHRCECFLKLESALSARFRLHMPDRYDHRPGFLGHIVVELMLDATLASRDRSLLDDFYAQMEQINPDDVEAAVNQMATRTTDRLAWFIHRFREERFLYDYLDDNLMFVRINQVLKRVNLPALEPVVVEVLDFARQLLSEHASELLSVVEATTDKPA